MAVITADLQERIQAKLDLLYGPAQAAMLYPRLAALVAGYELQPAQVASTDRVSERDVILITYGDLVQQAGQTPLATLHEMLTTELQDVVNTVHILPFFPYSSDDGFSVIDFLAVDPALGDWSDVARLAERFKVMFDAVINHISVQSAWFKGYLADDPTYRDFFIAVDPAEDLSAVTRPRTLPLLTPFQTAAGEKHVWTTFSADQVDLNYAAEDVLLAVVDVLLQYVVRGASLIRLDAIAYLWKTIGTTCIHLPETHAVVQLMRDVLDAAAPDVLIITETNVPHDENISYFGDGTNEAQLVYQFSLPPLILHSFRVGDVRALSDWAATLVSMADTTTYFNFTASHDGIGVRPAAGLISDEAVQALATHAQARGGQVSFKTNSDGTQSPYELNVTYVDAIIDPAETDPARQAEQFLASQAIMLAFVGVPGIYFHSLLGSRNWLAGVEQTGRARSVNREKLDYAALQAELADPGSLRHHIFTRYCDLIRIRTGEAAFHPNGAQVVLDVNPAVLALRRTSPDGAACVLALHNVSARPQAVSLTAAHTGGRDVRCLFDLVQRQLFAWSDGVDLVLQPFQVMWLKVDGLAQ